MWCLCSCGCLSASSGAHVVLDDDTDVGYVEDGTPCGPSMMCLDRKCLQIQALNMSSCPLDSKGKVCSGHGVSRHQCRSLTLPQLTVTGQSFLTEAVDKFYSPTVVIFSVALSAKVIIYKLI